MKKVLTHFFLFLIIFIPINIKASCYNSVSISGINNRMQGHQGTCRIAGTYSGSATGPCVTGSCGNSGVASIGDSGGKICFYANGFGQTTCSITISASCMCSGTEFSTSFFVEIAEWGFQNISVENYKLNKNFADATHDYYVTVDSDTVTVYATKNDSQTTIKTSPKPKSTENVSNTKVKYVFSGLVVGENKISITSVSRFGTSIDSRDKYTLHITRSKPKDVEKIWFDKTDIKLHQKGSVILSANTTPTDADLSLLTWASSNTSVATVNEGVVTAVAPGKATITATVNGQTASANITVLTDVNSIAFDENLVNIAVGQTKYLSYKIIPEDASNKNVKFASSNPEIVTIDETGNITGKASGKSIIEVETEDGEYYSECLVIVTKKVDSIIIAPNKLILKKNQNAYLNATINPTDAENRNIIWTSTNVNVATVNEKGLVIAVNPGIASIRANIDGIVSNEVEVLVEIEKVPVKEESSNVILYLAIALILGAMVFVWIKFKDDKKEY